MIHIGTKTNWVQLLKQNPSSPKIDYCEEIVFSEIHQGVDPIQLPRPEQRSKPTMHAAPLFPEVISR